MHRFAPLALATLLAASAPAYLHAQNAASPSSPFTDPANLAGERVSPRTGRELPLDGGEGDNAPGLEQLLRKLNTRASLMNIVAHPDDEDGGMLTLYARGLGARVADLSLTRGEGGQNAMTGDFEDALGLLRTQELLANDRYTGVTQMFGTEVDFGFSKTKEESFAKWGHQRVLYDVVRAIRIYRPLVLVSTWTGNVTDGHGQHQVSGEIAQEAFKVAGDPNVFPELTKEGILPWQPLRIYARVPMQAVTSRGLFDYATGQYTPARFTNYVTGQVTTTIPSTDVVVHEGTDDPLLTTCAANPTDLPLTLRAASTTLSSRPEARSAGVERPAVPASSTTDCKPLSYVQFARIGLGLQKSQIGPGVRDAPSGRFDVPYHLYGSRLCADKAAHPSVILSNAKDPCISFASASAISEDNLQQAPTARNITAWGAAPGKRPQQDERAEGPIQNAALTTQPNFFDGIDTSIEGIADLAPHAPASLRSALHSIATSLQQAQAHFEANNPEAIAPLLEDADRRIGSLMASIPEVPFPQAITVPSELRLWDSVPQFEKIAINHELRIKKSQLAEALALSLGIEVDATTQASQVQDASTPAVHVHITTTSQQPLTVFSVELGSRDPSSADHANHTLSPSSPVDLTLTEESSQTSRVTRPYFTRASIEDPVYRLLEPSLRNAAVTPWPLVVTVFINHHDHMIVLPRVVHSGPQPVQIVPPASLSLSSHAQVLPNSDTKVALTLFESDRGSPITSEYDGGPTNWEPIPISVAANCGGCEPVAWRVPLGHRQPVTLRPSITLKNGDVITEGYRPVGYGDLPRTNFYTPATDRIVPVDLKLPPPNKRRIAYLPGTGDAVPEALASIGLKPTILQVEDITADKLKAFDTVILGVRTYSAHPDLHGAPTQALLDFARNGGNVLVQYQTGEFTSTDAPFPLTLGYRAEKVVDETAPVALLTTRSSQLKTESRPAPAESLLITPNRITSADFNGWIEERGHGFLGSWDPHYAALTETHDPGQAPQRGGLITVQLGKGHWTYCAFALYRQLPEAVPGAFRLFVNLLNP